MAETQTTSDRLMTAEDLAEYCVVSIKSVYDWNYRGVGPTAMRVGRHLRYRRRDV